MNASPQMSPSPMVRASSEGPLLVVAVSDACVEPTRTVMMPITSVQPHAASARISLYTGVGSGGRLCTSSFHTSDEPSWLSVSMASFISRFAMRIRGRPFPKRMHETCGEGSGGCVAPVRTREFT